MNPDQVLVFSFIGMKTREIAVQGKSVIHVSMDEEAIGLGEVVAIGFGSQKKANVTGAVATVAAKVLESRPVQNVAQALQGVVPGLNFSNNDGGGTLDNTMNVNIRGAGTISGSGTSAAPLILVDGVEGNMNAINPSDIESITVLKDAASSAIYGARAANGVVLVTTKKGQKGKTRVTYSYSHTINYIRKNPSEYLSASDYIRMNRIGIQSRFRGDSIDNNTGAMNTDRNQILGAWGWAVNTGWRSAEGLYTTQLLNNQNRHLLNNPKWKLLVDPNPFNTSSEFPV